ncbi:MAG: ABC transporter ATP-binding protein [Chloroflexota bacterium]
MIEAKGLTKEFFIAQRRSGLLGALRGLVSNNGRRITAVDDIDMTIDDGEFVAYLGPNGAGKSTTIKMLTGILHPTRGQVRVAGLSPTDRRAEVARRIGVVFGQRTQLWWDLPVADSYDILRHMYRIPADSFRRRLAELSELLELAPFVDTPVRNLSLGQRMRADLAGALLHEPPVLFLDEPTIGLDIQAKERIRSFLSAINAAGTTILMTTHDLGDIERLCRRIILINHGRIRYDGTLAELRREMGLPTVLEAEFAAPTTIAAAGLLAGRATLAQTGPTTVVARFDRNVLPAGAVISELSALGEIKDVHISEPAIEEVIKRLYG